jgi:hypothetical protein
MISAFHGGNTGSNPVRVADIRNILICSHLRIVPQASFRDLLTRLLIRLPKSTDVSTTLLRNPYPRPKMWYQSRAATPEDRSELARGDA